jgi:hypothetical protein
MPTNLSPGNRHSMRLLTALLLVLPLQSVNSEPPTSFADAFEQGSLGTRWQTKIGNFRVEKKVLVGSENPNDGHGAVIRKMIEFTNATISFRFNIRDGRSFNVVINDKNCKTVHAGHICRVAITARAIRIADDKEGVMRNDIFAMRKDPARNEEANRLVKNRSKSIPLDIRKETWHILKIAIQDDTISVEYNNKPIGSLTSKGIAHPTKTDFGFTVKGKRIEFDDVVFTQQ